AGDDHPAAAFQDCVNRVQEVGRDIARESLQCGGFCGENPARRSDKIGFQVFDKFHCADPYASAELHATQGAAVVDASGDMTLFRDEPCRHRFTV
ncbi:MAG: hypothetical protein IT554_09450, partial [Sphingomonadaceae bacterium]|nr:hypothetical protein [Sphingomonadaceae bacterium]